MKLVEPIKKIDDINKIKDYLKSKNLRNYLIFVMGINTGIKTCQMLNLKINDVVDTQNNIRDFIRINDIEYDITQNTKDAIIGYLLQNNLYENKSKYLFKSNKGDMPIDRSHLYRILNEAAENCKVDISIGNETLRKTFGYHYYRQIGDLKHLQMVLNQKSVNKLYDYLSIDNEINAHKEFNL